MNQNKELDNNDWDFYSIINFIKENIVQILLFILVFVIIFIVDYISNINAAIFSMPSPIPGITSQNNLQPLHKKIKNIKVKKHKK
jgi:hypothetical protein